VRFSVSVESSCILTVRLISRNRLWSLLDLLHLQTKLKGTSGTGEGKRDALGVGGYVSQRKPETSDDRGCGLDA
jgi:hypothetical protein